MVASYGMMGWLGTGEGGLKAIRAGESGLETRWEGWFQMGSWMVDRGGLRG